MDSADKTGIFLIILIVSGGAGLAVKHWDFFEERFQEIYELELNQDQQQLAAGTPPFVILVPLAALFILVGLVFSAVRKMRTGEWLPHEEVEEEEVGPG